MNNPVVITGKEIDLYRIKVLLSALSLEIKGLRRRGRSVYSIVKSEFGLRGSRQSVYSQLSQHYHLQLQSLLDD